MTIEEMRAWKKELGYSYEKIAELSGLPVGTVQKVLGGITKSPRYETLQALELVFRPLRSVPDASVIKEESTEYQASKRQGEYDVLDYLAFPQEVRVELIDGTIYEMASPSDVHQLICDEINMRFREYIRKKHGKCITITAPLDVQLDCDEKTMVQPDVSIICDRSKFRNGRVAGAPDLVAEVLSPATQRRDVSLKMGKYMNAGVREYWIVDPVKKRVYVYEFEKDIFPVMYTFEHKVPVGIFDGECEVDFTEIYEYVSFLYPDNSL
ncbi:Uma2 family endonuclease [Dorea sp. YH-dor226]|uniref:Uma2 family endonuclease n=1 Tax=Dorea sp. YH-dor226 TaxID=3151119 RepID=UPI003242FBF0